MSMHNTASSGYIVPCDKLTPLLPKEVQAEYEQAIKDQDCEKLNEILDVNTPVQFPCFEGVYMLQDEDEADNIKRGVPFVIFQDEDLYVKEPKRQLEFLKANGINPEFERWTTWG